MSKLTQVEETIPGFAPSPTEAMLAQKPAPPEAMEVFWVGDDEQADSFPQFAKSIHPQLLEFYRRWQQAQEEWISWSFDLLQAATGNPNLNRALRSGSGLDSMHIRGVWPSDIDPAMAGYWKKPTLTLQGYSHWKIRHPMAEALNNSSFPAVRLADLPDSFLTNGPNFNVWVLSPVVFEHDGALWAGYRQNPASAITPVKWWPKLSPWEPIQEWEYVKAKGEAQEACKKKEETED